MVLTPKSFLLLYVAPSLVSLYIVAFSLVFLKITLFINLNYFSKTFLAFFLRSVFIPRYGFSQALSFYFKAISNLITLWTFSKTNLWFDIYILNILTCVAYSFVSFKLATSISVFSILILSGKKDKSVWRLCKFWGY